MDSAGRCLTENEVAEVAEGILGSGKRPHVNDHIAECDACRDLVSSAVDLAASRHVTNPAAGAALESTVPVTPEDAFLTADTRVGRYIVVRPLGAGAMGAVYEALDPELDRKVALKLLRNRDNDTSDLKARLLREAKAMARVSHPEVVTIHDVGTFEGQVFLAMELVDGQTVGGWLREAKRSWREVLDLFARAGRGLAAAHAAGLVHRDFKPENVLVGANGRVRVSDFGLARVAEESAAVSKRAASGPDGPHSGRTRTGALLGTPAFMAPEQWRGEIALAAADQFSFCVALYEGLYGERPFAGTTLMEIQASVLAGRVRDAPAGARVPAWLRAVILRGLRIEPRDRYPSMDALLAALTPRVSRRPLWVWGALAALVAPIAVGIVLTRTGSGEPRAAAPENPSNAIVAESRVVPSSSESDRSVALSRAVPMEAPAAPLPSSSSVARVAVAASRAPQAAASQSPKKRRPMHVSWVFCDDVCGVDPDDAGVYAIGRLKRVVEGHVAAVEACFVASENDPIVREASVHGGMSWNLTVLADGRVTGVGPFGGGDRSATLDACVAPVLRRVHFDAADLLGPGHVQAGFY